MSTTFFPRIFWMGMENFRYCFDIVVHLPHLQYSKPIKNVLLLKLYHLQSGTNLIPIISFLLFAGGILTGFSFVVAKHIQNNMIGAHTQISLMLFMVAKPHIWSSLWPYLYVNVRSYTHFSVYKIIFLPANGYNLWNERAIRSAESQYMRFASINVIKLCVCVCWSNPTISMNSLEKEKSVLTCLSRAPVLCVLLPWT